MSWIPASRWATREKVLDTWWDIILVWSDVQQIASVSVALLRSWHTTVAAAPVTTTRDIVCDTSVYGKRCRKKRLWTGSHAEGGTCCLAAHIWSLHWRQKTLTVRVARVTDNAATAIFNGRAGVNVSLLTAVLRLGQRRPGVFVVFEYGLDRRICSLLGRPAWKNIS